MARVPLLTVHDLPPEHRALAESLDGTGAFINLYRAMAHSPVALRRLYEFVSCLWAGALNDRIREIAILSVVSTVNARYPLGWHILDAAEAGLTPAEIHAIVRGEASGTLSHDDAAIAEYARALARDARLGDAAFTAVADVLDTQQVVELTLLVGTHSLVALPTGLRSIWTTNRRERSAGWRATTRRRTGLRHYRSRRAHRTSTRTRPRRSSARMSSADSSRRHTPLPERRQSGAAG